MNQQVEGIQRISWPQLIQQLRVRSIDVGCWASVLCLFFIPINKPLTNLCMATALLATLVGPDLIKRLRFALSHPIAIGALLWWGVLAISALYAPQSTQLWRSWLGLLAFSYPMIVISLIGDDSRWRMRAAVSFGSAVALIVLMSWLQFAGVIPEHYFPKASAGYRNVVFRDYIQQGFATLCFASVLFAFAMWRRKEASAKYAWMGMGACTLSILFVIDSRTAWLGLVSLVVLWCMLVYFEGSWGKKLAWIIFLTACFAITTGWLLAKQNQSRVTQIGQEMQQSGTLEHATSAAIRLELWRQSAQMIKQAPLFGHGFDQWHPQFIEQTKDIPAYDRYRMRYPHQEYLLIMAEQGLVGFAVFAWMLLALAGYISRLDEPYKYYYASLFLIYLVSGMANNLVGDFFHRHLLLMSLAFIPLARRTNGSFA